VEIVSRIVLISPPSSICAIAVAFWDTSRFNSKISVGTVSKGFTTCSKAVKLLSKFEIELECVVSN
jgi:hypothetical protein